MLENLREMAAKYTGEIPAEIGGAAPAPAPGGGGGGGSTDDMLAKLLAKMDSIDQKVNATAAKQQQMEAMMQRR